MSTLSTFHRNFKSGQKKGGQSGRCPPPCYSTMIYGFIGYESQINSMGRVYKSVEHQSEFKRNHRTLKSSLRTLALVGVSYSCLV